MKRGLRVFDEGAVGPDGDSGKVEMSDGTAAVAGGIAAIHRAEDGAAGWRVGDGFAGAIQTLFGRRSEDAEVDRFHRSGSGSEDHFANPAEAIQAVGVSGVRTRRKEERAAQGCAFACFLHGGLSAADAGATEDSDAEQRNQGVGAIGAGRDPRCRAFARTWSRRLGCSGCGLAVEAKERSQKQSAESPSREFRHLPALSVSLFSV